MKKERTIEFIARGVCVREGQLLLCRRRGAPRAYLPGGHIEFDEGARTALRREIAEELGRPAIVGRFLGAVEHRFGTTPAERTCEINLLFELRIRGLRADRAPDSVEPKIGFEWIPLRQLPRSDLEPWPLRRRLARWLAEPSAPGWAGSYPEGRARA